jgi:hypothetical protein
MDFRDLRSQPAIHLYAGEIPDLSVYRSRPLTGLSIDKADDFHVLHDVTSRHDLDDDSVDSYQSEDVFEHIAYDRLIDVVQEVYRILKPGGLFRLSMPDYRCDILRERSVYDVRGQLVFDPGGGGSLDRTGVRGGGHVWFPVRETVERLVRAVPFRTVSFLHWYGEDMVGHCLPIDYRLGYVQRTPDNDPRVAHPRRPLSIVVDCVK